jgi:hypothetical protein
MIIEARQSQVKCTQQEALCIGPLQPYDGVGRNAIHKLNPVAGKTIPP